VIAGGRWVLPFVLRQVEDAYGFVAVVLLAILGASLFAEAVGLSMALGAFVLGMVLSGSSFQRRIEGVVGPLKQALLALFFIAIGMSLDVGMLAERGGRMTVSVVCILVLKTATLYGLARGFGLETPGALRMAAMLSQAGEFGFVLFGAMHAAGLVDGYQFNLALLGIGMSMAITPLLAKAADAFADRSRRSPA
jgi:glutathione-regulated potassium-efflux system protein KefB